MNNQKKNIVITVKVLMMFLIVSCSTKKQFPVSTEIPTTDIIAKKRVDRNKNIVLHLEARYLPSPNRLSTSSKVYVVWIKTVNADIKNVGQIVNKNAQKVSFKTVTPFDFNEIFITAEENGIVQRPQGKVIAALKY